LLAAAGLILAAPGHAASLIMNVQSVTAAADTTGDVFNVTLTNTGASVDISGFSFGLQVGTANLSFTAVNTSTTLAPYIFAGNSAFGPDISVQPPNLPGQNLEAQDIANAPGSFTVVGTGATVGLGHVVFNLSPSTPAGPILVSFIPADDSLSDQNGNSITGFSVVNGTVTVTGTAPIPEPATTAIVGIFLAALLAIKITLGLEPSRSSRLAAGK
jgi:hypothetical protein